MKRERTLQKDSQRLPISLLPKNYVSDETKTGTVKVNGYYETWIRDEKELITYRAENYRPNHLVTPNTKLVYSPFGIFDALSVFSLKPERMAIETLRMRGTIYTDRYARWLVASENVTVLKTTDMTESLPVWSRAVCAELAQFWEPPQIVQEWIATGDAKLRKEARAALLPIIVAETPSIGMDRRKANYKVACPAWAISSAIPMDVHPLAHGYYAGMIRRGRETICAHKTCTNNCESMRLTSERWQQTLLNLL